MFNSSFPYYFLSISIKASEHSNIRGGKRECKTKTTAKKGKWWGCITTLPPNQSVLHIFELLGGKGKTAAPQTEVTAQDHLKFRYFFLVTTGRAKSSPSLCTKNAQISELFWTVFLTRFVPVSLHVTFWAISKLSNIPINLQMHRQSQRHFKYCFALKAHLLASLEARLGLL